MNNIQVKKLSSFMMGQFRDIMAVKWYEKITNDGNTKMCQLAKHG